MSSGVVRNARIDIAGARRPSRQVAAEKPSRQVPPPPAPAADTHHRLAEEAAARYAQAQEALQRQAAAVLEAAHAEGLAAGRRQAEAEIKALASEHLERFRSRVEALEESWAEERARAQAQIADLAFVATVRLLGAAAVQPHAVQHAVRTAISSAGAWDQLTVELHSADLHWAEDAVLPAEAAGRAVSFVSSAEVSLGGCRVRGASGVVDARLEVQLEFLRSALDAARQSAPQEDA